MTKFQVLPRAVIISYDRKLFDKAVEEFSLSGYKLAAPLRVLHLLIGHILSTDVDVPNQQEKYTQWLIRRIAEFSDSTEGKLIPDTGARLFAEVALEAVDGYAVRRDNEHLFNTGDRTLPIFYVRTIEESGRVILGLNKLEPLPWVD